MFNFLIESYFKTFNLKLEMLCLFSIKDMASLSSIPKFTRSGSLNSKSIFFLYILNSLKYFLHVFHKNKHFILLFCITYHLSVEAPRSKHFSVLVKQTNPILINILSFQIGILTLEHYGKAL